MQSPALLSNGNFPPCTWAQIECKWRVNAVQRARAAPAQKNQWERAEGGLTELAGIFAREIPINSTQLNPYPLYFHNEVSCFEFYHLRIMIFIMIFGHFSCCSFCLESVLSNIEKACSLISFWGMWSLTICLKFHRLSATNNPYSHPCFIFLHCADCHLTWIHLTYLFYYFLSLSPSRMLRQRLASMLLTAISPSTQDSTW